MTTQGKQTMFIRNAIDSDLGPIVEIYNGTIPSRLVTADIEPISIASKQAWFNERCQKRPIWVVEIKGKVEGWLSFTDFFNRRPAYHSTAEISIYISEGYRGRGIGKALLSKALNSAPQMEIRHLLGFIFAHNKPSLSIFEKFGFQQWGYLPKVAVLDGMNRDLVIVGRPLNNC